MDKNLYEAARTGEVEVIQQCTSEQLVTGLTPNKNTLLHVAAQFGQDKVVAKILEKCSWLVFSTNNKGDTALHIAAREGYERVVPLLLDCVKRLDQEPESGGGATKGLLRAVNEDGNTALHLAVGWRRRYDGVVAVEMLVEEDREFQHPPNKAQATPLYIATENEYPYLVSEILNNCKFPAFGGPGGRTALHAAALFSTGWERSCLELLLEKEYFVHVTRVGDDYGWTPLHCASHRGLTRPVQLLLEADKSAAYIAAEKDNNNTPLLLAATAGNVEVMEKLLLECPDCWEMVNNKGQNILHIALEMEQEEVMDFIIRKRSDLLRFLLNHKDEKGDTPLHLIARARDEIKSKSRSRLWFNSEADVHAFNNDNMIPNEVAKIPPGPSISRQFLDGILGAYFGWRNIMRDRQNILEWKLSRRKEEEKAKTSKFEKIEKMRETLLIVVALIATVTFAAGFTLPGGFDGNEGPNQGLAILVKKMAFKAFMISNTVAVMSSISSIFLHFTATMRYNPKDDLEEYGRQQMAVFFLAILAMIAMTIAFVAGGYAVLAHSPSLAISMCAIGCFPFFMYGRDLKLSCRLLREMAIFMWTDFVALAEYMWHALAYPILHPRYAYRWIILPRLQNSIAWFKDRILSHTQPIQSDVEGLRLQNSV